MTPKLGSTQQRVLEAAMAAGSYTTQSEAEAVAARALNSKRLLDRDKHAHDLWRPTPKAFEIYSGSAPASAPTPALAGRSVARRRIDSIDIGERLRNVDEPAVAKLMASIRDLGLQTPITVQGKPADERVTLSAGAHRLEAMGRLGEELIDCFHVDGNDLDRELWEIDENLCRSELTAADSALFTFRRKEIHLLKHPETAHGGDRRSSRKVCDLNEVEASRFTAETAKLTGQSERTVQLNAERGEKIIERALHLLRGTRLNNGKFLDRLKQIPADRQELYVQAALDEEREKAAHVKENRRAQQQVRHEVRLSHMAFVQKNGAAKAGQVQQKFPVIYADPPWRFGVHSEVTGREKSAENHYPTMETDAICALWEEIGAPAKSDAVLFLWATNPMLPDALRVMASWGFTYVHHWIWDKEIAGTGYWGRDRHELLLIGKRGSPVAPLPGSQPQTVYREPKTRHSAKPAHYAETIERLYPDMPRLEMFCRSPRPGWTAWGYEAQPQSEAAE